MESLELMPTRIRITSILKKAIFSGEIKSGDELSLTDVAGKLGVSRTPVREAFQTLASEGLITLRMNKGAIVNQIDEKFIKDIFEMLFSSVSTQLKNVIKKGRLSSMI